MKKSQEVFPNATESFERSPGLWTAYYDGRVGHIDIMDAEKYKGSQIFARNISQTFAKDFVQAGCNVTVILSDPTEAEAFRWVCDGVDVAAVLRKSINWGRLDDLTQVSNKASKKMGSSARVGSVKIFTFAGESSEAKSGDVSLVRGNVIPAKNYSPVPGSLMDYVMRLK